MDHKTLCYHCGKEYPIVGVEIDEVCLIPNAILFEKGSKIGVLFLHSPPNSDDRSVTILFKDFSGNEDIKTPQDLSNAMMETKPVDVDISMIFTDERGAGIVVGAVKMVQTILSSMRPIVIPSGKIIIPGNDGSIH